MGHVESPIEKHLVQRCKQHQYMCLKFQSTGNINGIPDRIVIGNGLCVFVELKGSEKKPRDLQIYQMLTIQKLGHIGTAATWARSKSEVDDIVNLIQQGDLKGLNQFAPLDL